METITQVTKGSIYNRNGEKVIMTIIDNTYKVTNPNVSNMTEKEVEESRKFLNELFNERV